MIGNPTIKRATTVFVTVVLIGTIFAMVPVRDVVAQYADLSPGPVAMALLFLLGNLAFGAVRFYKLIGYFGRSSATALQVARAHVAGLVSSLVVVNLIGSAVGRYLALRRYGVDVATLTSIVVVERVILVVVAGGLLVVGWIALLGTETLMSVLRHASIPETVAASCLSVLCVFAVFRWRREWLLIRNSFSAQALVRVFVLGAITLIGHALMLCAYAAAAYVLGDLEVGIVRVAAVAAIVSFAAGLPISVNGWGVREVASIFAFGQIGIPAPDAIAISLLIGVLSTLVVLLVAPLLATGRYEKDAGPETQEEVKWKSDSDRGGDRTAPMGTGGISPDALFILVTAPLTALLVFVTLHITLRDTPVALNFGDPFAVLAILLAGLTWVSSRRLPMALPRAVWLWAAGLSLLLVYGFCFGVYRFGVTDWALNNRVFGWLVLLGYASLGAMNVSIWGLHGLRRLVEVALVTAAVVVVFDIAHRETLALLGSRDFIAANFEGFSMNRNAFAFQLIIALAGGLAYSRVVERTGRSWVFSILLGVLIFGIWRTMSISGAITAAVLVTSLAVAGMVSRSVLTRAAICAAVLIGAVATLPEIARITFAPDPGVLAGTSSQIHGLLDKPVHELLNRSGLEERFLSIYKGIELWLAFPVSGAGLGAFAGQFLGENGKLLVIHSVPVWLLAEFGIMGLAVAGWLPCAMLLFAVRAYPDVKSPAVVVAIAITICFIVFGLAHDIAYQRIFWLFAGGAAAAWVRIRLGKRVT